MRPVDKLKLFISSMTGINSRCEQFTVGSETMVLQWTFITANN